MVCRKQFVSWIDSYEYSALKNIRNRKQFSKALANYINYWDLGEIAAFVEEMRGLDFYRSEDRAIFCDFFYCWFLEVPHESPNP